MMPDETKKDFASELDDLQQEVVLMGSKAERLILKSMAALFDRDINLADSAIADDEEIDRMELDIEDRCLKLLALHQPTTEEVRVISGVLKIITDLERLADHTTKISRKAKILSTIPQLKPYVDLPIMADKTVEMLSQSLKAFIDRDEKLAYQIMESDNAIDDFNHRILAELIIYMSSDPTTVKYFTHLMGIVQSIERIADHVTNICERTIYIVTGALPKDD